MNHSHSPWIIAIIQLDPISFYQMITLICESLCLTLWCCSYLLWCGLMCVFCPLLLACVFFQPNTDWQSFLSLKPSGFSVVSSLLRWWTHRQRPVEVNVEWPSVRVYRSFLYLSLKLSSFYVQLDLDMFQRTLLTWVDTDQMAGCTAANQCQNKQ